MPRSSILKPRSGSKPSSHHPSRMDAFSTPFSAAFMPLVPLASRPRIGVLSQTSQPRTISRATSMP